MNEYEKAYARNELRQALSDCFIDLFEEWSYSGLDELRQRSIDRALLTDDADKARAIAVHIAHRLMQVADAIDALNNFDEKNK